MYLHTAPGYDTVIYPMLSKLAHNNKSFLLLIYNDIWLNGEIAPNWKKIIMVPIRKHNKNPRNFNSYRGISLISWVLNTFERMVKSRLEWWSENNEDLLTRSMAIEREIEPEMLSLTK